MRSSDWSSDVWLFRSQQVEVADDNGQQIVEVGCQPAGELTDGLHPLGLSELSLERLALADIADDRHEGGIAVLDDLDDGRLGGELLAVLAPADDFDAFVHTQRRLGVAHVMPMAGDDVPPQTHEIGRGSEQERVVKYV